MSSTVVPVAMSQEERLAAVLAGLNEAQRAAVEHGAGGAQPDPRPLLVIAGAGSGKTSTLAHRVAHLIAHLSLIHISEPTRPY